MFALSIPIDVGDESVSVRQICQQLEIADIFVSKRGLIGNPSPFPRSVALTATRHNRRRMSHGKEALFFKAKLAERAERYADMFEAAMEASALPGDEGLTAIQVSLLIAAFGSYVGQLRAAWRTVVAVEEKQDQQGRKDLVVRASDYRKRIEHEIKTACTRFTDLVHHCFLDNEKPGSNIKVIVALWKTVGDAWRYCCECGGNLTSGRDSPSGKAAAAYKTGIEKAAGLSNVAPARLALLLNYAVYLYEVAGEIDEGIRVSREAFNDCMNALDVAADEESCREIAAILQALRDNLAVWAK